MIRRVMSAGMRQQVVQMRQWPRGGCWRLTRYATLLGVVLVLRPLVVRAQDRSTPPSQDVVSTDPRLDPSLRAALAPILDTSRARGLPTDPLVDKALEGVSKHADQQRIVMVVRALATQLASARTALGSTASTPELVAGASALKAGVQPAELANLAGAIRGERGRSLVVPLAVLSELVARGVPADTAASTVLVLAQRGAADGELVAFRQGVERDVAAGVLPAVAASVGAADVLADGQAALTSTVSRHPPPAPPAAPPPNPPQRP